MLILSPILLLYFFKILPNWYAKQKVIAAFFAGWDVHKFNTIAEKYASQRVPAILNPEMMKAMQSHLSKGNPVVVVSASCENWVKPWCEREGVDCIATRLEIRDGKITGKFDGKNCYGIEKVNRIKQKYNLSSYHAIYAYGDSRGDKEMLEMASVKIYKGQEIKSRK